MEPQAGVAEPVQLHLFAFLLEFIYTRLKKISFLGWYSRSTISANFLPNEPVPP
jgi:hypothetical protein